MRIEDENICTAVLDRVQRFIETEDELEADDTQQEYVRAIVYDPPTPPVVTREPGATALADLQSLYDEEDLDSAFIFGDAVDLDETESCYTARYDEVLPVAPIFCLDASSGEVVAAWLTPGTLEPAVEEEEYDEEADDDADDEDVDEDE